MLIDTHCHLDACEFNSDRRAVIERAVQGGVGGIVVPSVHTGNFLMVRELAHSFGQGAYALGIHPLFVPQAHEEDLTHLERQLRACINDPRLVAVGEIGLDFFVPELKTPEMRTKQQRFYESQLDLALEFRLPVILHVRRSQDDLLKSLRRRPRIGGIGHAFNGSFQQARQFVDQGFALGFGGAMTFERARRIRRLATQMPLENIVLETDAPDIPPAWLGLGQAPVGSGQPVRVRNEPGELPRIAEVLAGLRNIKVDEAARQTAAAAYRVLPRLGNTGWRQL